MVADDAPREVVPPGPFARCSLHLVMFLIISNLATVQQKEAPFLEWNPDTPLRRKKPMRPHDQPSSIFSPCEEQHQSLIEFVSEALVPMSHVWMKQDQRNAIVYGVYNVGMQVVSSTLDRSMAFLLCRRLSAQSRPAFALTAFGR